MVAQPERKTQNKWQTVRVSKTHGTAFIICFGSIISPTHTKHTDHILFAQSPLNYRFNDTLSTKISSVEAIYQSSSHANFNALCGSIAQTQTQRTNQIRNV